MNGTSNGNGNGTQKIIQRARRIHFRDTLPPEEYESLMELSAELAQPQQYDSCFFILGSYGEKEKEKLLHLQQTIKNRSGKNCQAYLMDDFVDGVHPMVKFQLIADYSDYILGVCEHDQGGFQLEMGMVIVLRDYFDQSYLLKRTYPNNGDREQYNWMLSKGVFQMFRHGNRLREWTSTSEFENESSSLLNELMP